MSGRCASCQHFEAPDDPAPWEIEWRKDTPWALPGLDWGKCELTDNTFDTYTAGGQGDTLAIAVDGSEYHAVLFVAPAFGCVMWEQREETA